MEANTVWMLTSTALVLFMTPGLALFYGGLVRVRSVVNMMMFSLTSMALVGVIWVLWGYSMSYFGDGEAAIFAGSPFKDFGLINTSPEDFVSAGFGVTFAIISTALISGAIADRVGLGSWILFSGIWATLVYFPVAAWVWGGGWIHQLGELLGGLPEVIDYAGGTVVHTAAGASALAIALVAGKRRDFGPAAAKPHSIPLVAIGAAILWFGWIGFNVGAASEATEAGLIIINTIAAPAAGILGWIILDVIRGNKPGAVGACSGAIAGLVAITPSCANLSPVWAILLGLLSGAVCALAIQWKYKLGYDDSLDVVGLHLIAGILGTAYLGFFAIDTGLFMGGGWGQLWVQLISVIAVAIYAFLVSLVIAYIVKGITGLRVPAEVEEAGIDRMGHGEDAYAYAEEAPARI